MTPPYCSSRNEPILRKILVFSPTGLTSKQIGLTAEIVEKLLAEDNHVTFVQCDAVLQNCYFNRVHNILGCAACQSRMQKVLQWAGLSPQHIVKLKHYHEVDKVLLPSFSNFDELAAFTFHNIPVGRGAASSIVSYFRDYHIDSEKYGQLIDIELRKAINVLLNFKELFDQLQPDELYLFNGRFAEVFPVMELATQRELPFYTIEAGAQNRYELFRNGLPHSIRIRTERMLELWRNAPAQDRLKIGREWFEKKRKRDETYEISFTKSQKQGRLPAGFDHDKRNILLLNSSEDELKAIMEWQTPLFKSQNEAIEQIVRFFIDNPTFQFYLRVHPNLGKVDNVQMQEISGMAFPNLTIIPPGDPIDTYHLIDSCEKVISFGSTAGIEATYWGKPAILYGKGFYAYLNATYRPASFEELVVLIQQKDLSPKPQERTLPYGFYWSTYGQPTDFFLFAGLHASRYKGKRLRKIYISALTLLPRYLKHFALWQKLYRLYYKKPFSIKSLMRYK